MKRLVISTLSALAFSSLVTPAFGSEIAAAKGKTTTNINEITPFNLVSSSYQGRFSNQGIPSYHTFLQAVRFNQIEAKDLVQTAIDAGRLSEDTLTDTAYLNSVNSLLDNLDKN